MSIRTERSVNGHLYLFFILLRKLIKNTHVIVLRKSDTSSKRHKRNIEMIYRCKIKEL